jgi:hypothetical protein
MFRKAVIDSGPLFSALVSNYNLLDIEYGRSIGTRGLDGPLLDPSSQRLFLELLNSIKEKLTTSHVIGELQGLEKSRLKLRGSDRAVFWRASVDLLIRWKFDEQLVRLILLLMRASVPSFPKSGPPTQD